MARNYVAHLKPVSIGQNASHLRLGQKLKQQNGQLVWFNCNISQRSERLHERRILPFGRRDPVIGSLAFLSVIHPMLDGVELLLS